MKFDPYGNVDDKSRQLYFDGVAFILLYTACCNKDKLSTVPIANVANLARFVTLTF